MELVLIIVVLAVLVWFFFLRNKEDVKEATAEVPYKLEVAPAPEEVKPVVEEVRVEPVLVAETKPEVEVAKPAKAKRTAKPKATKTETTKPKAKKPKMEVAK